MELITKVLADSWPILLVVAAIVDIGIVGILLWNKRKSKANRVVVKDSSVVIPQAQASKVVHAVLFDNGVARELNVPINLIQSTGRPLFPISLGGKKVVFLEYILQQTEPLVVSQTQVESKGNGGNGEKRGMDFLDVLGQKPSSSATEAEAEVEAEDEPKPEVKKQKRRRRKNAKRVKAKS